MTWMQPESITTRIGRAVKSGTAMSSAHANTMPACIWTVRLQPRVARRALANSMSAAIVRREAQKAQTMCVGVSRGATGRTMSAKLVR